MKYFSPRILLNLFITGITCQTLATNVVKVSLTQGRIYGDRPAKALGYIIDEGEKSYSVYIRDLTDDARVLGSQTFSAETKNLFVDDMTIALRKNWNYGITVASFTIPKETVATALRVGSASAVLTVPDGSEQLAIERRQTEGSTLSILVTKQLKFEGRTISSERDHGVETSDELTKVEITTDKDLHGFQTLAVNSSLKKSGRSAIFQDFQTLAGEKTHSSIAGQNDKESNYANLTASGFFPLISGHQTFFTNSVKALAYSVDLKSSDYVVSLKDVSQDAALLSNPILSEKTIASMKEDMETAIRTRADFGTEFASFHIPIKLFQNVQEKIPSTSEIAYEITRGVSVKETVRLTGSVERDGSAFILGKVHLITSVRTLEDGERHWNYFDAIHDMIIDLKLKLDTPKVISLKLMGSSNVQPETSADLDTQLR